MTEAFTVDCVLETKSSSKERGSFPNNDYLVKDQIFLGFDKIYVAPFLHRTTAIIPLPPTLSTATQEEKDRN